MTPADNTGTLTVETGGLHFPTSLAFDDAGVA
jgi:hypothetical protein